MKKAFLVIGIITIMVLNLIIWIGTGSQSLSGIKSMFSALIVTMDICLVSSSIYFLWKSYQMKQFLFTILFGIILLIFTIAFIIRMTDVMGINVFWLFAFDIFSVNVYLIYLTRNWNHFIES